MKTFIPVLSLLIIFTSCSSKDEQFCECLEIADELNKTNQKAFSENRTQADLDEIKSLQKTQTETCQKYFEMSGEEMLKMKEDCN